MIQLDLLEQLVAFYEEGTITKAAERLLISQPSLTRNLQRLETELDITLFERSKNKTSFNETGLFVVEEAKKLLAQADHFMETIHHKALMDTQLFIGVVAPGPVYEFQDLAQEKELPQELNFVTKPDSELLEGLLSEDYHIISTSQPVDDAKVICRVFFKEQLELSVPKKHILAEREELYLSDLAGLTMLLRTNLGIWNDIIEALPETNFITQEDSATFASLAKATDLPHFKTNITETHFPDDSRVSIPIMDDLATKTFYVAVLKKNRKLLTDFGI